MVNHPMEKAARQRPISELQSIRASKCKYNYNIRDELRQVFASANYVRSTWANCIARRNLFRAMA